MIRVRSAVSAMVVISMLSSSVAVAESPPVKKVVLPTSKNACLAAGGEWILLGPQMVTHGCMLKASDGGKSCKTSAQCQGPCVEHANGNRCAAYIDGCYQPTGRGTVTQCVN